MRGDVTPLPLLLLLLLLLPVLGPVPVVVVRGGGVRADCDARRGCRAGLMRTGSDATGGEAPAAAAGSATGGCCGAPETERARPGTIRGLLTGARPEAVRRGGRAVGGAAAGGVGVWAGAAELVRLCTKGGSVTGARVPTGVGVPGAGEERSPWAATKGGSFTEGSGGCGLLIFGESTQKPFLVFLLLKGVC